METTYAHGKRLRKLPHQPSNLRNRQEVKKLMATPLETLQEKLEDLQGEVQETILRSSASADFASIFPPFRLWFLRVPPICLQTAFSRLEAIGSVEQPT